jgi:hypothetical protein
MFCAVLHCTALFCTVLICTALFCADLHSTTLRCSALFCAVLRCSVLFCAVLHSTTLFCTALRCAVLHCDVLHCDAIRCTALHYARSTKVHSTDNAMRCNALDYAPRYCTLLYFAPHLSVLLCSVLCFTVYCAAPTLTLSEFDRSFTNFYPLYTNDIHSRFVARLFLHRHSFLDQLRTTERALLPLRVRLHFVLIVVEVVLVACDVMHSNYDMYVKQELEQASSALVLIVVEVVLVACDVMYAN